MEDHTSWKGHNFTLMVFGGIVFLCSIFFVLGMLVGRNQEQRAAKTAALIEAAKIAPAVANDEAKEPAKIESKAAAFQGVETGKPLIETTAAAPDSTTAPVVSEPPPAEPEVPAPAVKMIYLQVDALKESAAADKELGELKKKGFNGLVLNGDGPNKLYRVQIGPFSTIADADSAKNKLMALGYKPIKK